MYHVKAHITGPRDANDGVEVGAVVVAKAASVVDDPRDFEDVLLKQAKRVGVCEHQPGRVRPDGGA